MLTEDRMVKHPDPKTVFNLIFNWWTVPILLRGRRRELKPLDLPPVPENHSATVVGSALKLRWEQEKQRIGPSLFRAILKWLGWRWAIICILLAFQLCVLRLAVPLLIGELIGYMTAVQTDGHTVWTYVILFVLATFLSTFFYHYYLFAIQRVGLDIRVALTSLIYEKILVLKAHTISKEGIGHLLNILTNDLSRFDRVLQNVPYVMVGPLVLLSITSILWTYNGAPSLAGTVLLIIFVPSQGFIARKTGPLRGKVAVATDRRLRALAEMLDGMLAIKMNAWESLYERQIDQLRSAELKSITTKNRLAGTNYAVYDVVTRLCVLVTFLAVVLSGNTLTAQSIFITLSVYNSIGVNLCANLPFGISGGAELLVAIRRIQRILLLDEFLQSNVNHLKKPLLVELKNVTASWGDQMETLVDISLTAEEKNVIGVIGPVGSGKSSLLQVILGELTVADPLTVNINGSIAFVPQQAWFFAESIRNNILCGRKFDPLWYTQVIDACGLGPDLANMKFSDETLVGDKGVTLSGGQQARVNLARAVYGRADIILLDDPLSALDVRVARHVKEHCIDGLLRSKCVILVTHQTHFLREGVDAIISLLNGRSAKQVSVNKPSQDASLEGGTVASLSGGAALLTLDDIELEEPKDMDLVNMDKIKGNLGSIYGTFIDLPQKSIEIHRSGSIGWKLFYTYARIGNSIFFILFTVLVSILTQGIMNGSDYWLKTWADAESNVKSHKGICEPSNSKTLVQEESLWIYAGLVGALLVMALVQVSSIYHMVLSSSGALHRKLLGVILKAPFQFFEDTKDLAMKLFSSDIGVTDDMLPMYTYTLTIALMQVFGAISVVVILGYYLIIPMLIYILILFCLSTIYMHPSASIKRMESLAYTPLVGQLSNIISGVSVIRTCESEEYFRHHFKRLQDNHTSIFYTYLAATRWLTFTVELVSDLVLNCVVIYFVLTSGSSTTVGLAITEAMILTSEGTLLFIFATFLTNNIVSVERLIDYTKIEAEEPPRRRHYQISGLRPQWPSGGRIRLEDVSVAHRGGPEVLHNITVQIKDGEKVGIIGRTGAGKTSLVSTLFRIINSKSGHIHIDGLDIQKLSLHQLRHSLSIIQLNPILMAGTLRQNLDPFGEYSDAEIWEALEAVQLNKRIGGMGQVLQSKVSEGGSNFSQGERQLISLGRTILRRSKILVLDEATANVDSETDGIIQRILREKFNTSTILTIAHRLETVMDANMILVLDAGKIKEFDSPLNLLRNKNSYLSRLVEKTGQDNARRLTELAVQFNLNEGKQ